MRKHLDNTQPCHSITKGTRQSIVKDQKRNTNLTRSRKKLFYIGGNNGVPHIESALTALGMKRTTNPDNFFLKWVECQNTINYRLFCPGTQMVNHIENICRLTRKNYLLQTLKEYEVLMKRKGVSWKVSDICMETYHVDIPEEYEMFKAVYKPGEIWICKPYGRNQGKGIFLINDLRQLESKQKSKTTGAVQTKRIIQRYITNPLLIRGYKFDIRAYMLIASTDPYIVFYNRGYIRQACVPYSTETLDVHVHLTNQYIQKKHQLYTQRKEETVLSFDQFNDYVNTHEKDEKCLIDDWVYNWFTPSIKDIMLTTFKAVKHKLLPKNGVFELLGFDFMIDSNMKVWLIEVNINPALHTNCRVLQDEIPPIIKESLNIVVEIFNKKMEGCNVLPIKSVEKFEAIYNSLNTFEFDGKRHGASTCSDAV